MLQVTLIGHIGGNAEVKTANGKEFVAFRVANTERWTGADGQKREETTWVDVVLDGRPKVFEFLKAGQLVYVQGGAKLRVYSSEKDRCMKAGLTISAQRVELLGAKPDAVPATLYSQDGAYSYPVVKLFNCPDMVNAKGVKYPVQLKSTGGLLFSIDKEGFILPV